MINSFNIATNISLAIAAQAESQVKPQVKSVLPTTSWLEIVHSLVSQPNAMPLTNIWHETHIAVGGETEFLGILTEFDLLWGLSQILENKISGDRLLVTEILSRQTTPNYLCLGRSQTIFDAITILQDPNISCLQLSPDSDYTNHNQPEIITRYSLLALLQDSAILKNRTVEELIEAIPVLASSTQLKTAIDLMLAQPQNCVAIASEFSPKSSTPKSSIIVFTPLDLIQLWYSHLDQPDCGSISLAGANRWNGLKQDESLCTAYQEMQKRQTRNLLVLDANSIVSAGEIGIVSLNRMLSVFKPESMYGEIQRMEQQVKRIESEKRDFLMSCIQRVSNFEIKADSFSPQQIEQEYKLALTTLQIRQSFGLEEILETSVLEVSSWLQADRVFLCRFLANGSETIVAESVLNPAWSLLKQPLNHRFLQQAGRELFQSGNARVMQDDQGLEPTEISAQTPAKSSLAVAIPHGKTLWGILVVDQCLVSRQWQPVEVEFLERLAPRLAINIHQAVLLDKSLTEFTERRAVEKKLMHNALHDALTDLPNRILLLERLEFLLPQCAIQPDQTFALLLLDLDRFKVINDGLGHLAGDQLINQIAQRLKQNQGFSDMLARTGGDEFAILMENVRSEEMVIQRVEAIQAQLEQPFMLHDRAIVVSTSIGIVIPQDFHQNSSELLRDADVAVSQAKRQGYSRYVFFAEGMRQGALTRLQMESDLREAINQGSFRLCYQSIFTTKTDAEDKVSKLVGFEALLRWKHAQLGYISPEDFIPVAEETGLILPIGRWVLAEACQQMVHWHQLFPSIPTLSISVNISSIQVEQPDFVESVIQVLRETNLPPSSLNLEITESVLMQNMVITRQKLEALRSLGIKVHIDDFGTGYSSFSYLQKLPIDGLKIDRSFISRITEDENSRQIVQTIIQLAQGMGMSIIAEGIETQEQLSSFMAMGRECVQGFFFSKPCESAIATQQIAKEVNQVIP